MWQCDIMPFMFQNTLALYNISGFTFPWDGAFGWDLTNPVTILFGSQSAFIWGIQFMKSQFTSPITLKLSISYYKDTVYDR
jgi:hypothetical protein